MSTLIPPSNKGNIITYRNMTINDNSDKDSGADSGVNSDGVNKTKMTHTKD